MADKKISALTSATTPLAGTEVLPIVQSNSTVKVSVANLTVGREVTASKLTSSSAGNSEIIADASSGTPILSMLGSAGSNPLIGYLGSGGIRVGPVTGSGAAGFSQQYLFGGTGNFTNNTGNFVVGTAGKGIDFSANTHAAGMTSELLNWYEEGTWTPSDGSGASLSFTTQDARYTRVGRLVTISASITYPVTANGNDATVAGLPFTTFNGTSGVDGGSPSFTDSATALMFLIAKNTTAFDVRAAAGGATRKNSDMSGLTIRFTMTYTAK